MRVLQISAIAIALTVAPLQAGEAPLSVTIEVHANHAQGAFSTYWNFFGYDEPNYTYAPNGTKLLNEIARLSSVPAYIRVHNLLTSGDGSPSLKWGSTNAYTEDASGRRVYDWKIVDRIFDTFHDSGLKPLVEIGFMPEALSTHPQPYRHNFPSGSIYTGWAYPPTDYQRWADLVFQFTKHLRERYGDAEVKTWLWEVWNEPGFHFSVAITLAKVFGELEHEVRPSLIVRRRISPAGVNGTARKVVPVGLRMGRERFWHEADFNQRL